MRAVYEGHRDNDNEIRCFYNEEAWFLHFHSNVEIMYSDSDEKYVSVNGERVNLKRGEFCFVDSFDEHDNSGAGRHLILLIPLAYLENFNNLKKNGRLKNNFFKDENGEILRAMEDIMHSLSKNELIKQGLVDVLLGKIIEKTAITQEKFQSVSALAREIIVYINNNYRNKITLESLAKDLGYSKSHISHVINAGLNANLSTYLNRVRLQKFIEQLSLAKSKKKVITLAFQCGFDSLQTFYRNFKKEYNCTPYDYYKKKFDK